MKAFLVVPYGYEYNDEGWSVVEDGMSVDKAMMFSDELSALKYAKQIDDEYAKEYGSDSQYDSEFKLCRIIPMEVD